MSNEDLKKEQHEKLWALCAHLAAALDVAPADAEDELEEAVWEAADDLYELLKELFGEAEK